VIRDIVDGRTTCLAVDTPVPSQFSHEILNANPYAYLDDAPLEERRARAVEMRRVLPGALLEEIGRLDPAAIAEVCDEAWPEVRDREELHDALLTLIALPAASGIVRGNSGVRARLGDSLNAWSPFFEQLATEGRVGLARVHNQTYWVASERVAAFMLIFPSAQFETPMPLVESREVSGDDALLACVTGWMSHSGPVTATQLGNMLTLPVPEI